jgi:hypothetical protein
MENNMHTIIELWTPTDTFLALAVEERKTFFNALGTNIERLEEAGVSSMGWGRIEPIANSVGYDWFAVWRAPDLMAATEFLDGVAASGWYGYFHQEVVLGELLPVGEAIAQHIGV